MAKALRTVAIVAGVVALAATGIGAIGIGAAASAGLAAGAAAATATTAATIATIGTVASAVAMAASIGASLMQSRPPARGSLTQITIGANMPTPYCMGRIYPRSAMVHDVGYGGVVSDVPNPYRSMVFVDSLGPIEGYESDQIDFQTVGFSGNNATGYYSGFLYRARQLGACPESSALAGPWGSIPQWGTSSKLSGLAARLVSARFDKKGKVWASGLGQFGTVLKGALVYDQRLDDTYPGGDGDCRALDEDTYVGTSVSALNPSCHGVTYALGRWQNGRKRMGIGFTPEAIDWPAWTEFANVCDTNGWTISGTIFEPGSKWNNLKIICQAGGGRPRWTGGKLTVIFPRPRTALDTITPDDLADGEISIPAMRGRATRPNGIIPKYVSEAHKWDSVQSNEVSVSDYVTADGEPRTEERSYECVTNKDQAAQLAAYELTEGREIADITIPLKPRFKRYRVGDALTIDLPDEGLPEQLAVITGRRINVETGAIELVLDTETTARHDFALGRTGTAPPTPTLVAPETVDATKAGWMRGVGPYDADTPYFDGDVVQHQGIAWEHIGGVPTVGDAPPTLPTTANSYWRAVDPKLAEVDQLAADIAALAAQADAASNDNIWTISEKQEIIFPLRGRLNDAYAQLTARATALGLTYSMLTTARNAFNGYCDTFAYSDFSTDTSLLPNGNLVSQNFADWLNNGATITPGSPYSEIEDTSTGAWYDGYFNTPVTAGQVHRAMIVVKKEALSQLSQFSVWSYQTGSANLVSVNFNLNGSAQTPNGTASMEEMPNGELFAWLEWTPASGQTSQRLVVSPAVGSAAATGSIFVRAPVVVQGGYDALGADIFRYRRHRFETLLDALRNAISEADVAAGRTLNLVSFGSTTVNIAGNTIRRVSGSEDYTAVVRADPMAGACWAAMDIPLTLSTWAMLALDGEATGAGYADQLCYAGYNRTTGSLHVYENGAEKMNSSIGAAIDGKIMIVWDAAAFVVYVGGEERKRHVPASAPTKLWPKWYDYTGAGVLYTGLAAGIGSPSADETAANQVTIAEFVVPVISADRTGAIKSGQFDKVLTPTVTRNGVSIRTSDDMTYAVSGISAGGTGAVSVNNTGSSADKGRVTITDTMTAAFTFVLTMSYRGAPIWSRTIAVAVQPDAAPAPGGGGGGNKGGNAPITTSFLTSTSFVRVSEILTVDKAAGETIYCAAPLTYGYNNSSSGDRAVVAKWRRSPVGAGTWTDLPSSPVTGSRSYFDDTTFESTPGSVNVTQSEAPANGSYDIALFAAMDTGGGGIFISAGVPSVEVKV